jgi:tripartite-type tricarboxylate transporter receptor subunit TctC
LPTVAEAGLPAFTLGAWSAFQFPKGTPEAIVKRMHEALSKALDEEETRQRFASLGIEIASPDRRAAAWLAPFIKSEIDRWKPLLEAEAAQQKP